MNYPIQRPLHPLHINTSRWSSLEGAMGTPRYINVPIKHDKSSPRPGNSPRPVEPPRITIHFDSGRGTPGVSFGDAKNGKLHWMGAQFIPELLNLGQNSVNLVIYWPGYGHVQNTFPLEICVNNRPVTRAYLAQQVAKAYERFFDAARKATYAGTRNENGTTWEIGRNYSHMHFVLRSISNVHLHDRGVFQADIQILMG
ncbi:hypothetical protein VTO73DRAFT_12926 [Trametes versicolor]